MITILSRARWCLYSGAYPIHWSSLTCLILAMVVALELPIGAQTNSTATALLPRATPAAVSANEVPAPDGDLAGAEWIWSPAFKQGQVPKGDCYFRKSFLAGSLKQAEIHIAADSAYELFFNGKPVGEGSDWHQMAAIDLLPHLVPGKNTIAVHAVNRDPGAAGLVARVLLQEPSGTVTVHSTDATWHTAIHAEDGWTDPDWNDSNWQFAQSYGPLGSTKPWGNKVQLAELGTPVHVADPAFEVVQILDAETAGSLIAMAFDYRGNLIVSRDDGHLLLFRDTDNDHLPDEMVTFSEQLTNVQGILPLGQQVLATGIGSDGSGLYALGDTDHDGQADTVRTLLTFSGSIDQHGPHAIRLGRDGSIYVIVGSHNQVDSQPLPKSPYTHPYEGDLIQPRYEDPHGHAVGVPAPGGTIIRTNAAGTTVEQFAGGLRNAYDFAFLPDGELITFDADMEWDLGTPWYRPTRINHVPAGAELGWRSGWAKWPESYIDSLPAILNRGPGSPTGVELYDHVTYPASYQGALFIADRARGRIDLVRLQPDGASYSAQLEPFVQGDPLFVTDLAIGPDGSLYFCTGGHGEAGGIYQVQYNGPQSPAASALGQGILRAVRQPQIDAPWAQSHIATVRNELQETWNQEMDRIVRDDQATAADRVRAIDLMQLYGPQPKVHALLDWTQAAEPAVRARAVYLLGVRPEPESQAAVQERLMELARDPEPRIRRLVCETIVRGEYEVTPEPVIELLDDDDRFVRYAARRALEHLPVATWREPVLNATRTRLFLTGSVGLLTIAPDQEVAVRIIERCIRMLRGDVHDPRYPEGFISDSDYGDLLRVIQLALIRGQIGPLPHPAIGRPVIETEQLATELGQEMVLEYPTTNPLLNRELVRLLVYLQVPDAAAIFARELAAENLPFAERLHIAAYASRLGSGWEPVSKLAMIEFLDGARAEQGGHSLLGYVEQFSRQFLKTLTPAEQFQVLAAAADWPHTALSMLAGLPVDPGEPMLARLRALDTELASHTGDPIDRLRVGIVAVLARSGDEASLAHLRSIYQNEPERRATVAMGLTLHANATHWPFLVDSLNIVEGPVAAEVLAALLKVDQTPDHPANYRQLILLGLQSHGAAARRVIELLEHWSGQVFAKDSNDIRQEMATWQDWYANQFPEAPPATLPTADSDAKWTAAELIAYLQTGPGKTGDPVQGVAVFQKGQCAQCHRHGDLGDTIGPDLTTVAQRLHTKEILESILYPSHTTTGFDVLAIRVPGGHPAAEPHAVGTSVPRSNADQETQVLYHEDGPLRAQSTRHQSETGSAGGSTMPAGLIDSLELQEIADLFAFLRRRSSFANTDSIPRRHGSIQR